jgi:uroporphyrinogen III methyltransferase / synthase
MRPRVHVVGAGPGGTALVTRRAAELIATAELLLCAPECSAVVESLGGGGEVRVVAVGRLGAAELEQIRTATHGPVVRLVPGDPLSQPAVAAECLALDGSGVELEVVAGVPAWLAAAAAAGLGLRLGPGLGLGSQGAGRSGWTEIRAGETVAAAVARLLDAGLAPAERALLVYEAGTPRQRVVEGQLGELAAAAAGDPVEVGRVGEGADRGQEPGGSRFLFAGVAQRIPWWERRPLFGLRVLVTRPRLQAAALVDRLEALGAEVVSFATIRIVAPANPEPLQRAVAAIRSYDWLLLTSVNGVERFLAALAAAGHDLRALGGVRIGCIGPATADALAASGVRADVVPERYVAEGLEEALRAHDMRGARVLLPRAAGARTLLPEALGRRGAHVDDVESYRTEPDAAGAESVRALLARRALDVVTFTSPSTVQNLVAAVGAELGGARVAVIGPVTAAAARAAGLSVWLEAEEHTIPGLVEALARRLGATDGGAAPREMP